jgi:NAD(P)-dependent dehydrogenase (short-subunit alcohol dehydrogenase family)
MYKVLEKVIIVTGGSGLIGKEIVNHCKENGAIVINADISIENNISLNQIKCDVTTNAGIDHLIKVVMDKYHRIDGLVNNAYPRTKDWGAKFEDIPYESWQKNVDMQMNSVFYLCQKVLKIMSIQKNGSIVNIASIYGVVGNDFRLVRSFVRRQSV